MWKELPDGHRASEPPDPISNSEVKRCIADGSVGSPHVRVGHYQALFFLPKFFYTFLCLVQYLLLYFSAPIKKPHPLGWGFFIRMGSLAMTYSHMGRPHTTIGAKTFHFWVRNGVRWFHLAMVAKQKRWMKINQSYNQSTSLNLWYLMSRSYIMRLSSTYPS